MTIVTALLAAAALFEFDSSLENNNLVQFLEFKSTYGRNYQLEETVYRYKIFSSNLEKIAKHNADKTQTYTMGVTQFADMTQD